MLPNHVVAEPDARARRPVERDAGEPPLAVIIITRNEERWIAGTIAAAIRIAAVFPSCEVALVDSCSSDRTVAVAERYPIRIVELNDCEPLCAALGRVVGQALTRGRHLLFVDGDTEIEPGWVIEAVRFLDERPEVAGVGGKLHELYYGGAS